MDKNTQINEADDFTDKYIEINLSYLVCRVEFENRFTYHGMYFDLIDKWTIQFHFYFQYLWLWYLKNFNTIIDE